MLPLAMYGFSFLPASKHKHVCIIWPSLPSSCASRAFRCPWLRHTSCGSCAVDFLAGLPAPLVLRVSNPSTGSFLLPRSLQNFVRNTVLGSLWSLPSSNFVFYCFPNDLKHGVFLDVRLHHLSLASTSCCPLVSLSVSYFRLYAWVWEAKEFSEKQISLMM